MKFKPNEVKNILISRTDSIGDVILTLPLVGVCKLYFPNSTIYFLGKSYTHEVIKCCANVDNFIDYSKYENKEDELIECLRPLNIDLAINVFPRKEIARALKKLNVTCRVGTFNRLFHWATCNVLPRFSRKKSDLHESQLNIQLLKSLPFKVDFSIKELSDLLNFENTPELSDNAKQFLSSDKQNIILHPRSQGSAMEWGIDNYVSLIKELNETGKYNIILTGTQKEGDSFRDELLIPCKSMITDTTGKLSLSELISLIANSQGLVAASTGPLHIASALGINCLGLFIMKRPMHPGRWKPIGKKAQVLVHSEDDESLDSITRISATRVFEVIKTW